MPWYYHCLILFRIQTQSGREGIFGEWCTTITRTPKKPTVISQFICTAPRRQYKQATDLTDTVLLRLHEGEGLFPTQIILTFSTNFVKLE